jgi:hypothetical protein
MFIAINLHWFFFGIISGYLLYRTLKTYTKGSGYLGFFSKLNNVMWGAILLIFAAIWGGIFIW